MSEADVQREVRRSRQDLVVPPRQSKWPVAFGALACGCLGFSLVLVLGIGRRSAESPPALPDIETTASPVETAAEPLPDSVDQPLSDAREPGRFQGAAGMRPARDDRWRPQSEAAQPGADEIRPASLEASDLAMQTADQPRRFSRFSTTDLPPAEEPAGDVAAQPSAADATPDSIDRAASDRAVAADDQVQPVSSAEPEADSALTSPGTDATAPAALEPAAATAIAASADESAAAPAVADPADDAASNSLAAPPEAAAADAPSSPAPAAAAPPEIASSNPSQPPAAPPQAPAVASFAAAPTIAPPQAAAATPQPRFAPPPTLPPLPPLAAPAAPPPPPAAAVASPFAAAPAIVVDPAAGPRASVGRPGQSAASLTAAGESGGQGRPGPLQLEGVQSPQLAVEKRGPREIQVGKPARYEVLVRNVGSATANDVVLRDAVPFGTSLITTTPPASPATSAGGVDAGDLVWSLGQLPPGGQARVVIELMPQTEGEIGSVASVSFRADASVRSRATKPALSIACSEPLPTLIGRDAGLTITVSNPGSGIATGVVLEGFLPENVSHRSGRELEFDVGQLKPGEARTIELVLGTRGPGVHQARFAARGDGGLLAEQGVKLEVTAPTLELAIDMPLRRFLQRSATCEIAMVNAGTATARSIELAAQLPPGVKFVRANNAGWHDERTHRVLWNLEELPPGETGHVEVVVMPVELGPQKIVAAARSADGLADQVAHVCEVEGLAALFFEVTDSEDPIEVDGVTEYVVRVGNQGTKSATGVRLSATLLGDLEPVEARGPSGHRVDNLTVSFEPLAKLAPGEEAVFRVGAKGRTAGDQRVQVQLTSEDHPAPITKEEVTRVYDDR